MRKTREENLAWTARCIMTIRHLSDGSVGWLDVNPEYKGEVWVGDTHLGDSG